MATNKVQENKILDITVPVGTKAGDFIVSGYLRGIALTDRRTSGKASVDISGVWDLSVTAADEDGDSAVSVGDALFYDAATSPDRLDKNSTGTFFAIALEAISSGETATINVLLVDPVAVGPGAILARALGAGLTGGGGTEISIDDEGVTGVMLAAAIVDDATIEITGNALAVKDEGIGIEKLDTAIVDDVTIEIGGSPDTLRVKDEGISLAKLASAIAPAYIVIAAGNHEVTSSPTDTTQDISPGVSILSTDIVLLTVKNMQGFVDSPHDHNLILGYAITESPDMITVTGAVVWTIGDVISWAVLRAAA